MVPRLQIFGAQDEGAAVLFTAAGRFRFQGVGCPTTTCQLQVTAPDAGARTIALGSHCTESVYNCRDACAAAEVKLRGG